MAQLTQTVAGNIAKIYDLRTVGKDNKSVLDFSVAVTTRTKQGEKWVDGDTNWVNCTAWGRLAENIAEHWQPGDRVILIGRVDMKPGYTDKNGNEREARPVMTVDLGGHDNSYFASVQPRKNSQDGNGGGRSDDNGGNRSERRGNDRSEQKQQSRRSEPAKAAPQNDDDFDLDFGDLDGGDDDLPF